MDLNPARVAEQHPRILEVAGLLLVMAHRGPCLVDYVVLCTCPAVLGIALHSDGRPADAVN